MTTNFYSVEMEPNIKIGDRVLVKGKWEGFVRWIGETEFKPGVWVGVELCDAIGKNDGSVQGVKYFDCPMDHGIFIRPQSILPYSPEARAATAIQSSARMHLAKKRMRSELNSKTWNALDNADEHLMLRRNNEMVSSLEVVPARLRASSLQPRRRSTLNVSEIIVEPDYDGPHLPDPITLESVLDMLEYFKNGKTLHAKYASRIITDLTHLYGKAPTLVELTLPADGETHITICGDTHGQLQDLFTVFTINGLPSPKNMYLFNGDFVDRGEYGSEVVLTLYAFKLLFPDAVHLNRGNHECRGQNAWMGFEEEVLEKYDRSEYNDPLRGTEVYELFQESFESLPLCTLIQNRILVLHGGLFSRDGITLSHIKGIMRKRPIPIGERGFEDRLMEELLWSDPRPSDANPEPLTGRRASARGAGIEFGPDVTTKFCRQNGISLIIRSHECVEEGYEILHNNRLITIFSASFYCGTMCNKGAFVTLGADLQPEIQQFYAHGINDSIPSEVRNQLLEQDTIHRIVERICDHKADLYWYYSQKDDEKNGKVSRLDWANGLSSVLDLDIPFLTYQSKLVELGEDGMVNYTKFLERYRIQSDGDTAWQGPVVHSMVEKLYEICGDVTQAFRIFDADESGMISYEEFVRTLESLNLGLSRDQIYQLMRTLDTNQDGQIDLEEFSGRFEVTFTQLAKDVRLPPQTEDQTIEEALGEIGKTIIKHKLTLEEAFSRFDRDKDGTVSYEHFADTLAEFGLIYSESLVRRIAEAIDTDHSLRINYHEFVAAFRINMNSPSRRTSSSTDGSFKSRGGIFVEESIPEDEQNEEKNDDPSAWKSAVVESVSNVLYQHRLQLLSNFRSFDEQNSGRISSTHFKQGLQSLGHRLSEWQIDNLVKALSENEAVNYRRFIDSFRIVDMNAPNKTPGSPTALARRSSFRGGSAALAEIKGQTIAVEIDNKSE